MSLPATQPGAISFQDIKALFDEPPQHILDIGANNGWTSRQFLETFPTAHVFSFEPDPRAVEKFKVTVSSERSTLFQVALGAQSGFVEFFLSDGVPPNQEDNPKYADGWDQSGSIRKPKNHLKFHPWCTFDNTLKVELLSLDDWSAEHAPGPIDFVWADVQGAEEDLIRGGSSTLARTRYFYTEYSSQELYEGQLQLQEVVDLLPAFDVVTVYEHDVLFRNKSF